MSERNEHNDGNTQTAYFAGGCFWGLERYFQNVDGVTDTTVGYAQSTVESPTYEQVCAGGTDAAETVKVEFNPAQVSLSARPYWSNRCATSTRPRHIIRTIW